MTHHYIFDLFGTLVVNAGQPTLAKTLFPEADYQELRLFLRRDFGSRDNCITKIEKRFNLTINPRRRKCVLQTIDQGIARATLFPYAKEVLSTLRDHSKIGLLSNNDNLMESIIDKLHLRGYFDAITLSHQVGVLKPDDEIYLRCIDRLNVRINDVIMVGNDLEKDVKKPIRLGMMGLLFDPYGLQPSYEHRVTSLKDILGHSF